MGTMRRLIVGIALACLSLTASSETLKIFVHDCNSLGNGGLSQVQKNSFANALTDNKVDFAYFYSIKATSYFGFTCEGYDFVSYSGNATTIAFFAYDNQRFKHLKTYDRADGSSAGTCTYCVALEEIGSGNVYGILFTRGSLYNLDKRGYQTPIKNLHDACLLEYPTAKTYIAYLSGCAATRSALTTYLSDSQYLGLTKLYDTTGETDDVGGVYADPNVAMTGSGTALQLEGHAKKTMLVTVNYATAKTVTFTDSLSDWTAPVQVAAGTTATPPTPPEHEGYDFVGWEGSYENVTEDCTVTAKYAIKTFTVTFLDKDGATLKEETVEWQQGATAPDAPAVDGWQFIRWEPADFSSVTENLTVQAVYEELSNVFTVRFLDADGETVLKTEHVIGGEGATAPDAPTPGEGQLFYGWSPADFSNITADLDVVAVVGPAVREAGTVEELAAIVANLTAVATVKLTADLDFAEVTGYVPPTLIGTFDGDGHKIFNLKNALFDKVLGGTVKDLTLATPSRAHTGHTQNGAFLANRLEGATVSGVTVENGVFTARNTGCGEASIAYHVTSDADGHPSVVSNCVARNCRFTAVAAGVLGGIVGEITNGSIVTDCRFESDSTEEDPAFGTNVYQAGGIAGYCGSGTIERCSVTGSVYAQDVMQVNAAAGAGGIVGGVGGTKTVISCCTNAATVVFGGAGGGSGGIVGRVMKATCQVNGCVNLGNVRVSGDEKGTSNNGAAAGGLIGGGWGNLTCVITDSLNDGTVMSQDGRAAGGLIGDLDGSSSGYVDVYVTDAVNRAAVVSPTLAGGLVGRLYKCDSDLSLVNSGNLGLVASPTGVVGGLVGRVDFPGQNNTKDYPVNGLHAVVNAGALVSESGTVGQAIGSLGVNTETNAYPMNVDGAFFIARVGTPLVGALKDGIKDGTGVFLSAGSRTDLTAADLKTKRVVDAINVYATANELPLWVRTKTGVDLSLFGEAATFGLVIVVQ